MVRYIAENEDDFLTIQDSPPQAYLALVVEGRVNQAYPLRGEVKLGREKDNAIVIADQKVSRHHATLKPLDRSYIVNDEGSANGTYVNGVLIAQPTRLRERDKIILGDTEFLFTADQPALDSPVQRPAAVSSPAGLPVWGQSAPSMPVNTMPVWLLLGCMGLIIVVLLFVLALMVGLFMGSSQAAVIPLWVYGLPEAIV